MGEDQLDELEGVLGYGFSDRRLLKHALTHSSRKSDLECSNERMEFLGDGILGIIVSEYLYHNFPDYTEGDLTRVKSVAVSRDTLVEVARSLGVQKYLIVAKGVARTTAGKRGARDKPEGQEEKLPSSLLSDALEALIAAVYLDGGLQAAEDFVMRHMHDCIELARRTAHVRNFKSILQQVVQRKKGTMPVYRVAAEEGPDHVKWFTVVTMIDGDEYGTGHGSTKKATEQEAAERTLAMMGQRRILEEDPSEPD